MVRYSSASLVFIGIAYICVYRMEMRMTRADSPDSRPRVVLEGQTLTIDGEAIPIEHRKMPLEDVRLDPSNPRIQHAVKQISNTGAISQEALRKLILDQPGLPELFKLIRDNGGLHEAIYVRPDG